MNAVNLTIRKTIKGELVRYHLEVTTEVATHYYKIRKEQPELTEWEAYKLAKEE